MSKPANDGWEEAVEIGERDLQAYAEGRLGAAARRRIEGFLAANPDLAANVMTRMHTLGQRGRFGRWGILGAALVSALSVGLGWKAADHFERGGWRELDGADPPEYVTEAAESREASRMRERMASQIETTELDTGEIRRTLNVDLPRLPPHWRVVDVQVYPSDEGPGVNLVVETGARRRLDLFAVRASTVGNDTPEVVTNGRESAVFWERGKSAYVLSGALAHQELLSAAAVLAGGERL